MIACYGWTWEYIDDYVTLPRLKAINKYQRRHPPLHILVQSFAGYEGVADNPNPAHVKPKTKQTLADLIKDFAAAGGSIKRK